ncbi:hypothetical protein EJ03DRAFT_342192 [Teratosphaeria nubilosa]|uniref:DNA polymerase delta subunit 3 n=1 Tax=Teratosphaeria nubilosa TaxID=161662 RepID=A0A6G1LEX5_9PEZI|nr:hypothetical protein EJ03DRAFT_342192 [Teratosphaeria nubilosa]
MAQDPNEWLALNVLNEQHLVNYRMLSRALKVHSNVAKQMLDDFHRKQNAKKPGSVHATYLLTGARKATAPTNGVHGQQDGEDAVMQSSPPLPSSSMPKPEDSEESVAVKSVLLAKEEHLEQAKATFESITGSHIYSLQAKGLSDVQSLTECNRKVTGDYASEDPLVAWKQYGVIQNPHVKRRTLGRKPPPPVAPGPKDEEAKSNPLPPTTKPTVLEKQASKESQDSKTASRPSSAKATSEPQKKPAAPKRENSNLFKSFAKSKTKPKNESQDSSAAPSPAPAEDEPMNDFSDEGDADEGADDDLVDVPKEVDGKSKKDREKELQAMMEQEDEVMEDAADADNAKDDELEHGGAIDEPKEVEEPKETVTTQGGRRRGRRRIMKKKTVKDEDGYLVTREEAAWESFSEDEPAPKKAKTTAPAPASKVAAGGKKASAKGQGNIMSFFGKK